MLLHIKFSILITITPEEEVPMVIDLVQTEEEVASPQEDVASTSKLSTLVRLLNQTLQTLDQLVRSMAVWVIPLSNAGTTSTTTTRVMIYLRPSLLFTSQTALEENGTQIQPLQLMLLPAPQLSNLQLLTTVWI
ncbi:unnamed protein product [Arabidopsis halleri]